MNILIFSGLDPSGGAGLLRDVISIHSQKIYNPSLNVFGIITVTTAQNTQEVTLAKAEEPSVIWEQFVALSKDYYIDVVKIGLIHHTQYEIISIIINTLDVPVILDPIIKSSSAYDFGNIDALRKLIPKCSIITPNMDELLSIADAPNIVKALQSIDTPYVLVTATDTSEHTITHSLYHQKALIQTYTYTKLPHTYHGSGCTLCALIAAYYTKNPKKHEVVQICQTALDKTYSMLENATFGGSKQLHPNS